MNPTKKASVGTTQSHIGPLGLRIMIGLITMQVLTTSALADPAKNVAAAEKGDLEAMFMLGSTSLLKGDYREAKVWLEKAASKNHAASKAALGFLYFNGFACEKNLTKARTLYEQSAKAGAHQGLNNLAHLYRYGLAGLKKDLDRTVKLLEESAEKGNTHAVNTLSILYRGKELGDPDLATSLKWLKFGAERNNPGSLSDLGFAHQHGIGVKKDTAQAVTYYEKAIAVGSVGAQSNLGYLYLMGEDVKRDYARALKLFTSAAEQGHDGGMINLAVMKFNGLGCERSPEDAFKLLMKAGKQGNAQARQLLIKWTAEEESRQKK